MNRFEGEGMYRVELYARVRLACHVEGLSQREAALRFGIDRKTVSKMLKFAVPPGYRRSLPPRRPKLDGFELGDRAATDQAFAGAHHVTRV